MRMLAPLRFERGPRMSTPFGARLRAAMDERGPLCPGIDPHAALLRAWGIDDTPAGLERFALTAVEALAPVSAVVKPQSAFFERHGSQGIAVLERVLAESRAAGALVLLDVKRGDIGTTAQGYADAYLDPASTLAADAITVSPFLGFGSVQPFVDAARAHDAGLFVLATIGRTDEDLAINGPLLAPGVGAQGGDAEAVARIFGDQVGNVVPSSSREILGAGPSVDALREAAARANDAFRALVG